MTKSFEHRLVWRKPFEKPCPAVFFDRDGVLIEDKHYLSDPEDVMLCPGAQRLLAELCSLKCPVVIVTNQSGIARGYFGWDDYLKVTYRMLDLLGEIALISAIYANGYSSEAPESSWRKPSPAMLVQAASDLNLDLSRSLLVGDRLTDLQAGSKAGLAQLVHVLTGHGLKERPSVVEWAETLSTTAEFGRLTALELVDSLRDFQLDWIPCR